jgi:hypothetical protein
MAFHRLTSAILILAAALTACTSDPETVELPWIPESQSVGIPVEIDAAALTASGESVALGPVDGNGMNVIFERSPAIFGASDDRKELSRSAYCGVIPSNVSARTFEADAGTGDTVPFAWVDQGGRLALVQGSDSVLAYNYEKQLPAGVDPVHERSSYIHPIWDLKGTAVTDDFPEDHYHHRGLSWMWPRVFVDGEEYDLWALRGIEQVFDEWLMRDAGSGCAVLGVKNHWEMMEDGRNVVDEWVWMRAYPADAYGRAIDVRITLEANEPVEISGRETDDKGYGGFSLRYAPRDSTVIVSPEGREEDSDHRRYPWADESGLFRGSPDRSGIAIFQHPGHPDFPAQWTLRHYGFIGVAWPSLKRVELAPGEPLTLRYRLWVHRGGAGRGRVAEAYEIFRTVN